MFQVRFHGRGGQGAVTAAELLSVAAFKEERFAQAFPSFGSERTGAPVVAFCRIDDKDIRLREPVVEPDALVVQDATLLHSVELFQGLATGGFVVLNTRRSLAELGCGEVAARLPPGHVVTVGASELALEHVGRPLPNVPLLGALAALTGIVSIDAVASAISDRFPPKLAASNIAAARAAFAEVTRELSAPTQESRC